MSSNPKTAAARREAAVNATSLTSSHCAKILRAMGDQTRLRILRHLVDGEKTVNALTKELRLPQPRTSHHLAILRQLGLVSDEREGRQIHYRLHPAVHHQLSKTQSQISLGCCSVDLKKEDD